MTKFERLFVWLGGALFVTALAVCAYYYMVVWGGAPGVEPAVLWHDTFIVWGRRRVPVSPLVTDTLLFGLFAVHHSVFARERVKARLARLVPERLVRSVYVWTASVLLVAVCVLWQPVGGNVFDVHGWRIGAHVALQLIGICIIAAAVRTIDPLELAGIHQPSDRDTLQITGPYRWVRHPLYLGWILTVFGAAHMTGDRLAFAVITSIYLVFAVPWEERSLMQSFGGHYAEYKRRVKWRIVPFVY
jgi:protein-S-isoprenylcysteine O-methyltransferase Ste14